MTAEPPTSTNAALIRQLLADRPMPCPACGYQLQGIAADRCPECGVQLHLQVKGRGRVWLSWSLALLAFLTAAALCSPEVYDDWVRNIKYPWRRFRSGGQFDPPFAAEHAIFTAAVIAIALLIIFRKRLFRRRARVRWGAPIVGALASLLAVVVVFDFYLFAQPRLYGISPSARQSLEKYLADCGAVQDPSVREIATFHENEWDIGIVRRFIDTDGSLVFQYWGAAWSSDPEWTTSTFRTTDPGAIALFNALYRSEAFELPPAPIPSSGGSGFQRGWHVRSGSNGAHNSLAFYESTDHEFDPPLGFDSSVAQHMALKGLQRPDVAWACAAHWIWGEHSFWFVDQEYRDNPPVFGQSEYLPPEPSRLGLLMPYGLVASFRAALESLDSVFYLAHRIEEANASVREAVRQIQEDRALRDSIQTWITHHAHPSTAAPGHNP